MVYIWPSRFLWLNHGLLFQLVWFFGARKDRFVMLKLKDSAKFVGSPYREDA